MAVVLALPARGEVLLDARGSARALRVSWHHDEGIVVLSMWHEGVCTGSFRLDKADVPAMVNSLVCGLASGYDSGHAGSPEEHRAG